MLYHNAYYSSSKWKYSCVSISISCTNFPFMKVSKTIKLIVSVDILKFLPRVNSGYRIFKSIIFLNFAFDIDIHPTHYMKWIWFCEYEYVDLSGLLNRTDLVWLQVPYPIHSSTYVYWQFGMIHQYRIK
jgi:hypothetical protein